MSFESDVLLAGARRDNAKLGDLLKKYEGYIDSIVRRCCAGSVGSRGSVSDLVQNVNEEAISAFSRFQGDNPEQFMVWLREIGRTVGAEFLRRNMAKARDAGREV